MSQPNHIDLIEFPTNSIEELQNTKQFFSQIFGWEFKDWGDDYADTKDSGVSAGLIADSQSRTSMPLAVIYVADLEATYKKVVDTDGVITKEIFPFPGGRRFHFKDPAGNELAAWSK
jgi:predicted enzyme related to lactoylglutathione lyase